MKRQKIALFLSRLNLVAGPAFGFLLACWFGHIIEPLPWLLRAIISVTLIIAGSLAGIILWKYTVGFVLAVLVGILFGTGILKEN